ncbi:class I SAM-dependent methyltransferase [Streptomyces alkaliphilus]|uniref:class I SAM-dependent methyltransferase n=1 Tax=Streptomyces alkaliphilus TaxID=1472722 RepID=UPI00117DB228|nr:SAM-dependent methyltransferase [Streptomyces alkaliphilus]MQS08603.1 SAM-dependent methyltransferase [Streptomyces alkaliphilus]
MTPTLIHHDLNRPSRTRDWAEIQERMLLPLYEAVYERTGVGPGTRLLELNCGSGLALLRAAARGASVTGTEPDPERLRLAGERLLPDPVWGWGTRRWPARLLPSLPANVRETGQAIRAPFTLITSFGAAPETEQLRRAVTLAEPGATVVLSGRGEPEECAVSAALRVGDRLARTVGDPQSRGATPGASTPPGVAGLREVARAVGLHPVDEGEVGCPFGYPGMTSALRGLLATGSFDDAVRGVGVDLVAKELAEALHPYLGSDGSVWLPNILRYVVCRVDDGTDGT